MFIICFLLFKVADLTDKNLRLTSRVLQLEAGTCPTLEDVLMGLEDESATSSTAASTVTIGTSSWPAPKDPAAATVVPDKEPIVIANTATEAAGTTINAAAFGDPKSTVAAAAAEGGVIVASGSDTEGGGVTTDQSHSSSSESDSDVRLIVGGDESFFFSCFLFILTR